MVQTLQGRTIRQVGDKTGKHCGSILDNRWQTIRRNTSVVYVTISTHFSDDLNMRHKTFAKTAEQRTKGPMQ